MLYTINCDDNVVIFELLGENSSPDFIQFNSKNGLLNIFTEASSNVGNY